MFPEAMSILARRTCVPSSNSPLAHPFEQTEILFDRPVAIGALLAGLGQGSPIFANLVGAQTVHVRFAVLDQVNRVFVKLLEIIRGVEHPVVPVEAKPSHVALNGLLVLDGLLARVRIVKSQITKAFELGSNAEIQADGFCVTNVQVTIRLGRKPCVHTAAVLAGSDVFGNTSSDEI